MKLRSAVIVVITALFLVPFFTSLALSVDDPGFSIKRMVMTESIADREPAAINESFSAATGEVFCFLEAVNIEEDTSVSFVWYHNGQEMARVSLPLEKGRRWRTFSSKKIAGLKGEWKVELLDTFGVVLNTVSFQVQ
jgi:Protein of unknown function (DUF2914)